jgi:hypothetical protein
MKNAATHHARSCFARPIAAVPFVKLMVLLLALCSGAPHIAAAQSPTQEELGSALPRSRPVPAEEENAPTSEKWAIHGQLTNVTQSHPRFASPYSGTNSLQPNGRTEETTDITLYAGTRLWRGAELWLNPEVDQGFGLNNTVGLAGFASGEAYKVGANTPTCVFPGLSSGRYCRRLRGKC